MQHSEPYMLRVVSGKKDESAWMFSKVSSQNYK